MESLPYLYTVGGESPGLERPTVAAEFGKWSWRQFKKQSLEVRIPIGEITSVGFITGVLETRVDLRLRSMKATGEIQCTTPGLVQLQIARRYRDAAREMASLLSSTVAEQHLEQLEQEIDRMKE